MILTDVIYHKETYMFAGLPLSIHLTISGFRNTKLQWIDIETAWCFSMQ